MTADHTICAWCWRDGQLTVLSEGTDPIAALLAVEDHEVSHGVCGGHSARILQEWQVRKHSLAGGEI